MINKFVFAGAIILLPIYSLAQSRAYFYNDNINQPTVEPIPNSNRYLVAETIYKSVAPPGFADNAIHLVQYDQAGNILNEKILDEGNIDNRSIDLTYINPNTFLLTSSYHPGTYMEHSVQLTLLDINFNILAQRLIQSTNLNYADLVPTDAIYDAQNNQIAICGVADEHGTAGGGGAVNISRAAFALTCNMGLNPLALKFYNTTVDPNNWEDYDRATRIVMNNTGKYYITGGENVLRNTLPNTSGIRNMLVDPITLNIVWSRPLQTPQLNQNSVDMFQSPVTGHFITLVNSTFDNYWHLIRINPATGAVVYPSLETFSPFAPYPFAYGDFAYNIMPGDKTGEVVVSGMKFQSINRTCYSGDSYNKGANPFMATIDISTYPGNIMNHIEYYSLNGADQFWYMGGIFAPLGTGTNVPVYLNNFVDRNPGGQWGMIAPINSPGTLLNTKYLDLSPNTTNGCDDIVCAYEFETSIRSEYSPYPTQMIPGAFTTSQSNLGIKRYDYVATNLCSAYHKPSATDINETPADKGTSIYPNPANDLDKTISFEINDPSATNQQLDIFIIITLGQQIYKESFYNNGASAKKIATDKLSKGLNMVYISCKGQVIYTGKVTKM